MSTPVGPYSPAMRAGPWLVCSGQLGLRQSDGGSVLADESFEVESRQALANVSELLVGRGASWANVVKVTVFLADIADYAVFNDVYTDVLGSHRPARTLVAVAGLPRNANVEVEVWAYAPDSEDTATWST